MRKLVLITCGYLSFLPVLLCLVSLYPIKADNYPQPSYPWLIADFHERLQSYLQSQRALPQAVLVGPSYVSVLREFEPVYNIGLSGAGQCETLAIVRKYCREDDRILYAVTIWDFMRESSELLNQAVYDSWRRLFLLHEQISPSKGPPEEVWLDSYWRSIKVWTNEIDMVANAAASKGIDHDGHTLILLIKQLKHSMPRINRAFDSAWEPDLSRYHELHRQFPNMVFVMFPSMPFGPIEPARTELAHTINIALDAKAKLKKAFEESGLPYVDCSQPELLGDLFHSTPEGNDLLRERLTQIIAKRASDQLTSL